MFFTFAVYRSDLNWRTPLSRFLWQFNSHSPWWYNQLGRYGPFSLLWFINRYKHEVLQNIFPPEFEISQLLGWIKSPSFAVLPFCRSTAAEDKILASLATCLGRKSLVFIHIHKRIGRKRVRWSLGWICPNKVEFKTLCFQPNLIWKVNWFQFPSRRTLKSMIEIYFLSSLIPNYEDRIRLLKLKPSMINLVLWQLWFF